MLVESDFLYAKLPSFAKKVEKAKRLIEEALAKSKKPYCAFSGGKDSSVMLHLIHSIDPSVTAIWSDDEWNLPETLELIDTTPNVIKVAATIRHSEFFTSWSNGPVNLPKDTVWIENAKLHFGIQAYAVQNNYDASFVGIRSEESRSRKQILRYKNERFRRKDGLMQIYPIIRWTTADIWAYIAQYKVPYNKAYDRLDELGIERQYQRIGPFAVEVVEARGQMVTLKRGWPDLYLKFTAKYPQARNYV